MITNHSKLFSSEFFQTYLTLIMDRHDYTLEEAVDFMTTSYFHNNLTIYGPSSKEQFELAIIKLSS